MKRQASTPRLVIPAEYVIKGILGLGIIGTLVTLLYNSWRARVQPITYTTDVVQVSMDGSKDLALTYIAPDGDRHDIDRFSIAKVILSNDGNKDYEEFDFRIALPPGLTSVETTITSPDSSHIANLVDDSTKKRIDHGETWEERRDLFERTLEQLSKTPGQCLYFRIDLFNRGQSYTVTLNVVPIVVQFNSFQRNTDAVLYHEKIEVSAAVLGGKVVRKKRLRWSIMRRSTPD
jgi:hypothetical protein